MTSDKSNGDEAAGEGGEGGGPHSGMLVAFWGYLVVIIAGLVYFSVIGLTHN